ncbi:hypothetical protein Q3G72_020827 [Acer saccharum]|nr:hypothetical protein Q3G72_014012 [Acer saccharum]KAK1548596.1 hypothetical protein Q3G72_020827 [Acer saccharum]
MAKPNHTTMFAELDALIAEQSRYQPRIGDDMDMGDVAASFEAMKDANNTLVRRVKVLEDVVAAHADLTTKALAALMDAADVQKRIGAQYAKRLDALEAEVRAIKEAMSTLIETAPTPAGESPHG